MANQSPYGARYAPPARAAPEPRAHARRPHRRRSPPAESIVRSARGDLEAAVPIARDYIERAEQTGATACAMASSWVLGDAFHREGRFAEAREVLKRGTATLTTGGIGLIPG